MIAGSIRRGIVFFCLPAVALCVSAWAQDDSGADGTMEMIFPIVHSAFIDEPINLQTTFTFANRSTSAVQATITTYQSDGTPVRILELCTGGLISAPPPLDLTLDIPPGARRSALTTVDQVEGNLPGFAGWAKVVFDRDADLWGSSEVLLRTTPEGCAFFTESTQTPASQVGTQSEPSRLYLNGVQVPGVRPATEFWASAQDRSNRQSAFSIVNPSESETAHGHLVLSSGSEVTATREISLPPMNSVSGSIAELSRESPCSDCFLLFRGSVRFTSNIPIAVGGIETLKPDGIWLSLPVEPVALPDSPEP
ncbi:MAG: hypothetical protein WAO20_21670 [Acidobacteriota bacterium]